MPYTQDSADIELHLLDAGRLDAYLQTTPALQRQWIERHNFRPESGQHLAVPDENGNIARIIVGYDPKQPLTALAHLPAVLPPENYRLAGDFDAATELLLLLGWGLGSYRYGRYRTRSAYGAKLYLPESHGAEVTAQLEATNLVRDLVNTPPWDMGPEEIANAAKDLADRCGASYDVISGEQLRNEYPAIHAVGMGSVREPRLITLRWGDKNHPKVCLVGKGVAFDTGGLNMKSGTRMLRMKKDMGGAAHVLGLAQLIIQRQLPLQLVVMIPAVENMVSGHCYRPGDVVHTRRGLTVEITNTDAEGRVILSDALQRANEEQPEVIIDFATLTGAARVAMGPDVPPVFSNDEELAVSLRPLSRQHADPLWPMPLVPGYERFLESEIADLSNCPPTSFAGAINAAIFLNHFADSNIPWLHLDVYAWNDGQRPGRPNGGEAQGLRAIYYWLRQRFQID
ncbi:MAG: leucyl aminopeptidase family protein [Wenzhouxiangellaceae bacterium]